MNQSDFFQALVKTRQSDRGYTNQPIDKDKLDRIIEAARIAPSACNAQPWKFIVIDEPDLRSKIADSTSSKVLGMNHFTKQAPVQIVVVLEEGNFNSKFGSFVKRKNLPLIDIGIAAEHICLAAASEELGSCMIGWFDEAKVKKLLNIPKAKRPILIITLGYPAKPEIREKRRKETDKVLSYNKY